MINFLNLQKKFNQITYLKKNEKTIFGELKIIKKRKNLQYQILEIQELEIYYLDVKKELKRKKKLLEDWVKNEISSFNFLYIK